MTRTRKPVGILFMVLLLAISTIASLAQGSDSQPKAPALLDAGQLVEKIAIGGKSWKVIDENADPVLKSEDLLGQSTDQQERLIGAKLIHNRLYTLFVIGASQKYDFRYWSPASDSSPLVDGASKGQMSLPTYKLTPDRLTLSGKVKCKFATLEGYTIKPQDSNGFNYKNGDSLDLNLGVNLLTLDRPGSPPQSISQLVLPFQGISEGRLCSIAKSGEMDITFSNKAPRSPEMVLDLSGPDWQEALESNGSITFQVRGSKSAFTMPAQQFVADWLVPELDRNQVSWMAHPQFIASAKLVVLSVYPGLGRFVKWTLVLPGSGSFQFPEGFILREGGKQFLNPFRLFDSKVYASSAPEFDFDEYITSDKQATLKCTLRLSGDKSPLETTISISRDWFK